MLKREVNHPAKNQRPNRTFFNEIGRNRADPFLQRINMLIDGAEKIAHRASISPRHDKHQGAGFVQCLIQFPVRITSTSLSPVSDHCFANR